MISKKKNLSKIFLATASLFVCSCISNSAYAELITLSNAEKLAIENSHALAAQGHVVSSTTEQARGERVKQLPMLGLDGQTQFMSKVGQIQIPAIGVNQQIGDHYSWSVGPVINWVAWDAGQIGKKAGSLRSQADSEKKTLEADQRQVLLNARAAYAGVLLAKDQVNIITSALELARAQYAYVNKRKEVGSSDKFNATVAHQEVADRELDLEQAKGELSVSKRNLVAAIGLDSSSIDPDEVDVESTSSVLAKLLPESQISANVKKHPEVESLEFKQKSSELAASSAKAAYWPKLTVQGKSSFDYPNLGQLERVQQNTLKLGLSMPIFDWGLINKQTKTQTYLAMSALEQKKQTEINLERDLGETRDNINTFKAMRDTNIVVVKDASEVAALAYDQFKIGKVIFLDVQRANNRMLSAKVQAARTDAKLAVEIARLLSLAKTEGVQ